MNIHRAADALLDGKKVRRLLWPCGCHLIMPKEDWHNPDFEHRLDRLWFRTAEGGVYDGWKLSPQAAKATDWEILK